MWKNLNLTNFKITCKAKAKQTKKAKFGLMLSPETKVLKNLIKNGIDKTKNKKTNFSKNSLFSCQIPPKMAIKRLSNAISNKNPFKNSLVSYLQISNTFPLVNIEIRQIKKRNESVKITQKYLKF